MLPMFAQPVQSNPFMCLLHYRTNEFMALEMNNANLTQAVWHVAQFA